MTNEHRCRLRYHGDDLDLAGSPEALRALAKALRATSAEAPLTNGTLVQTLTDAPLTVTLDPGPALHVTGSPSELEPFWSALESTAAESETAEDRSGAEPHRHVGPLVVTADWPFDPLAGL
ncbi:hypothetical protein KZZ52_22440 [Dactylosporangium sp. AC04546]|uniref:hypothetical protein n=1 Tax=Dactylosporangium sp. AC04546 TaxID=2862460 RepID=UPI001EDCE211|nr:hypothetical protein [Dactylosporangium sp. AC04546]WVK88039.1 hypothetical protein KZZ52_22440 [Dactylosporangium sp. AC04546]